MADPRSRKPSKPFGLVTERQFGLERGGQDGINSQTEDNRRRTSPEPEEEPEIRQPARRRLPDNPPPPPPPQTPLDRFHKYADQYITVAKPHSITYDPVRLPGAYELVQDAIDYAEASIIPSFTGNERVVIEIHGGEYTEDITISSDRIDLHGIGMPHIKGTFTLSVSPTTFIGRQQMFAGIHFDGVSTFAVDFPAYADVDAGPGAPFARPIFFKCWFHSTDTCFRTLGKIKAIECYFWMDADSYTNLEVPTVWIYSGTHAYWTEFYRCVIAGAVDDRAPAPPVGFPNTGMAWRNTAKLGIADPGYTNYVDSGVIFRNCTIQGWGYNECWQTVHDRCYCYGGRVDGPATGESYCFNSGDSSLALRGRVFFDVCEVACRYLVQESDMTLGVAANCTDTYLRIFDQLSNGSSYLGSMIVAGVTPFGGSQAVQGTTYGKLATTYREWFNSIVGPAEGAILLNCDSDVAHYAANGFAFPSAGIIQGICLNPYRDG